MTWMFLRRGQTIDTARESLQHLLVGLDNIPGRLSPPSARPGADAFVRWTEDGDRRLRLLYEDDQTAALYDERFWRIREIDDDSTRPAPLIEAAVSARKDRIEQLLQQLDEMHRVCGSPSERLIVLDTNIYDHYQPLDAIPWPTVFKVPSVRILIPLVVVDELDRHKDGHGTKLAERASKVLRLLRTSTREDGNIRIRKDVVARVVAEPAGHVRRPSNDDEIVRQTAYFSALAPDQVTLVSADYGMQIRAETAAVAFATLAEEYRIPRDATAAPA